MNTKLIGQHIRVARMKQNLTQCKLAKMVSLSSNYLSMLERGSHLPKLETLIFIAKALKIPASNLLIDVLPGFSSKADGLSSLLDTLSDDDFILAREFILSLPSCAKN
ncbi:MAG: helix-turn-helix transcriptional regulator [Eubacterium sp.]